MESRVPYRVYALVDKFGKLKSITFHDENGMRYKQMDFNHGHGKIKSGEGKDMTHIHLGYEHNERGSTFRLSQKEKRIKNFVLQYLRELRKNGKI